MTTDKPMTLNGANAQEPSADFKNGYMACSMALNQQVQQQNMEFVTLLIAIVKAKGTQLPEGCAEIRLDKSIAMTMPPGTALERFDEIVDGAEVMVYRMLTPEVAARKNETQAETGP